MAPDESLWQAGARLEGVTSGTFYARFRRYLQAAGLAPTGIHVLRHTAAKLRRDAGESIEDVSAFLDHCSPRGDDRLPAPAGGSGGSGLARGGRGDRGVDRVDAGKMEPPPPKGEGDGGFKETTAPREEERPLADSLGRR